MEEEKKRLFFGIEILAPWPEDYPKGKLLLPQERHVTLAFLGNILFAPLQNKLPHFPPPPSPIGTVGIFDQFLFLPKQNRANVVSYHAHLLHPANEIPSYQKIVTEWLLVQGILTKKEERVFLPHVTVCRKPFVAKQWQKAFSPLPFCTQGVHLYESLGHSRYAKIWSQSLLAPFTEIAHTADIAFLVRGRSMEEISLHAQIALAFSDAAFVSYIAMPSSLENLDDVIIDLNRRVATADAEVGTLFKAVSYSGEIKREEGNLLTWEMIVDV